MPDESDAFVVMTRRRPTSSGKETSSQRRHPARASSPRSSVPEVYREMLVEAFPSGFGSQDRLPKRRKVIANRPIVADPNTYITDGAEDPSDDDIVFEDVLPDIEEQIIYNDSGDDSDNEEEPLEDIEIAFDQPQTPEDHPEHLDLTLKSSFIQQKIQKPKARVFTKAERAVHLKIHKMHLLCLLHHFDRRNDWCNDEVIRTALMPLVSPKIRKFLSPESQWTAFRKSESIKRGLEEIGKVWKSKFNITARGMYRPFWCEEGNLQKFQLLSDSEPPLSKKEFRDAAAQLEGSRDLGVQLYCALLRGLGLEVRLVCSLQPLPLATASKAPTIKRLEHNPTHQTVSSPATGVDREDFIGMQESKSMSAAQGNSQDIAAPVLARRRLGHSNAADYRQPETNELRPSPPSNPRQRVITESPYPVYWIEVLDEPHQKWIPVDPLVTTSVNKARVFEPPASDEENAMSYVVAFESEGTAKDVTRRYTRWYAAKTRRTRVESTEGGERWWRKTLRFYSRGWKTEVDESEDATLADCELREGMPVSIADFKGHPRYVLERDIRRNEVLVTRHEVGKIRAGKSKQMESVFRRSDVKAVKSADGWYRLGRQVKAGEQPVKTRPLSHRNGGDENNEEEAVATPLYAENQTEIYVPPPVVSGKVPRNKFGNFDVYVPSMIPRGGIHIRSSDAARAASLLGVDYAGAVTGFEFRGRQGTAVLTGVIVASEYSEAINAVLEGFIDERTQAEEDMRLALVLRTWKRYLAGLRIKRRVDSYAVEGEGDEIETPIVEGHDSGMDSEEYEDDGGGGFFHE